MTMDADSSVTTDPFTGQVYSKGVEHESHWGYLLAFNYSFFMKRPTRNNVTAWSITPMLTMANTFSKTPYKENTSLLVSFDFWIP